MVDLSKSYTMITDPIKIDTTSEPLNNKINLKIVQHAQM